MRNTHPLYRPTDLDEKFNRNILTVVCLAGLVRVILEMDINTSQSGILDFYLDLGYGVIMLFTLVAIIKRWSYRVIYLSFYVPLVLLLCLTLIDRRGLASSTENNIHVGLIVIALTMRGSDAWRFSLALIVGTFISLMVVEYQHDFLRDFSDYSTSRFNYIFMGIGTIVVIYYAKIVFEKNKVKLSELETDLSETHQALDHSNSQLEAQTAELEMLNRELEIKVEERKTYLNEQRKAIRKYLEVTMEELDEEHTTLQKLTEKSVRAEDDISRMILTSSDRLKVEIDSLLTKLKTDQ